MTILRSGLSSLGLAALVAAALVTTQCTPSASPTGPTATLGVAGVVLIPSSSASGTTVGGIVTLTAAAPAGGATVSLVSSNVSAATVPASLTVAAGATTAPVVVTAVSTGTSVITATMNGVAGSTMLTVTARAVLQTLTLSSSSVIGGNAVTGTITLTDIAPDVGAVVALSSGGPAVVPQSVTVPTGQRTATFTVSTREVGGTIATSVTASYGSVSASTPLQVMVVAPPTVAVAGFGISGSIITDTCVLMDGGNHMDCTFDGSLSTAPGTIVAWNWSYSVETTIKQTTSGPVLSGPATSCNFLPPPPLGTGLISFPLTVSLTVRDSLGNVSAVVVDDGARLLPNGLCGY